MLLGLLTFLAGVGIGLATAAPIGPVNILAISTTLRRGRWAGLRTGLGALAADSLIAIVAGFGVTSVIAFVTAHARGIQLVGGAVLAASGLLTIRARPRLGGEDAVRRRGGRFLASFAMTLANPGAVIGMVALFGALKPLLGLETLPHPYAGSAVMVAGVVAGGAAWWTGLAFAVAAFGRRVDDRRLATINRIAGAALVVAGLALAGRAVLAWMRG